MPDPNDSVSDDKSPLRSLTAGGGFECNCLLSPIGQAPNSGVDICLNSTRV